MHLVKGIAYSCDDFAFEVAQVPVGKCLLGITAPSDSYMKRLVIVATSLKLTGELVAVAQTLAVLMSFNITEENMIWSIPWEPRRGLASVVQKGVSPAAASE